MVAQPDIGDRYRLLEPIGAGGMGQVHRAWDSVLERHVAIKRLHRSAAAGAMADPHRVERFRREAAASSRLAHENLVSTLDVLEEGSELALVMELVEGPTLRALIDRRGPLPLIDAVGIARQLASGLAAVHSIGVVHRDLKPANILIDAADRVRIADFGIAHLPSASRLTADSAIMGTPEYMAPERFRVASHDPTIDVYSVGAIVYELLTGAPPVTGDSPLEVLSKLYDGLPREPLPESAAALRPLLDRCLATEPSDRPVDGSELVRCLDELGLPEDRPDTSEEHAVLVLGGLPLAQLVELTREVAEVGQTIEADLVVRFDAVEAAFRFARDLVAAHPTLRAALDCGPVVGAGIQLFAGEAVGRAARIARLTRAGGLLVGPGGNRALGLGLRASLEALGEIHLQGSSRPTLVYRWANGPRQSAPHSVPIVAGVGRLTCPCGHTVEAPHAELVKGVRLACTGCGQLITLESNALQRTIAADSPHPADSEQPSRDRLVFDIDHNDILQALGKA